MYTTLTGDLNNLNDPYKIMKDGFCDGLDLKACLSLLSKVIEVSDYIVDVTNKHVAIDNKAFSDVATTSTKNGTIPK